MANKRTYQFGCSRLTIEFGDITTSTAQVLVSSDDYYLSMGGGVSASILRAGGQAIALDAAKKVPAVLGDVVVTTAGSLPAQYIFHAITIGPLGSDKTPKEIIRQTTSRCMQTLEVTAYTGCKYEKA
jgi:O-acetyl-ADP-ribose deacetylase (regulator of RNase III)